MKILIVNNLATLHGGAETIIVHLRHGLEEEGHQVRVLCGSEKGNGENIADARFLTFKEGGFSPLRILYVFNPFALLALRRELKNFQPDVVHLHNISKASPFILLLLKKYPAVLTVHDHSTFDPTRISDLPLLEPYRETFSDYFINKPSLRFYMEKLRFAILRYGAKNVDTVLACSDFYATCARDSGIFKNIKTLRNGIILPPPSPIIETKKILFVGRLSEEKGAPVLIEAANILKNNHPDMRLDIVGCGNQMAVLKKKISELKLGGTVRLLEHKSPREITELYRQSSLVVVPSLSPDNLPTVCIEAMSIGRPVVASRMGGLPELVDHEQTGLLVAPNDAGALASSIDRLLSDPELLRRMGEAGRKKAEKEFDDKSYIQKTLEEYEDLISKYKNI